MLKDISCSTPAIIDAIGLTWYQAGIVSKELQEIGWRTNVFLKSVAAVACQVGLMGHTLQSTKVWSLVDSAFPRYTQLYHCCDWFQNSRVKNCGAYFVYELLRPYMSCAGRYCGNGGAGKFLIEFLYSKVMAF